MNMQSHPTRVRGLKQDVYYCTSVSAPSHPTRVRGLKRPLR